MGLKVGIVGAGSFAQKFIPLFKAHPLVDEVTLCDIDVAKLEKNAAAHGIKKTSPSLDHLLTTDVDAVVIITQNWLHAPQATKALRAGKHVYSAVPMGIDIEEISAVVKAVEDTGKIYMMGETSYYYPGVIFCREKFRKGEFGHIVYGEGEYYHDFDRGLYDVCKWRGGADWKKFAANPPMYYVTHSASQIVSVTGAHMTHVSCQGYVDRHEDGLFKKGVNIWDNVFSNQSALFKMSDGSICRINEFRRIGNPAEVRMTLFGTEGSFEQNNAGAVWTTKTDVERVDDLLECGGITPVDDSCLRGAEVTGENDRIYKGVAKVHPVERLPKEYIGLSNGHNGSHQFLADDFVKACVTGKTPAVNVWEAARYTIPGIIAHQSCVNGGVLLDVPDFGDPKF